ncbi:unnamed protein product [Protopolystoma xenopodis]|uniref:Uncharacterized protein n=1 Tax=Protopolystoma xenopodis TaxID=117903 RepID=A0A448X816_9PLAT|nr:unnamed protein product [Protopolystoma xenopodis]
MQLRATVWFTVSTSSDPLGTICPAQPTVSCVPRRRPDSRKAGGQEQAPLGSSHRFVSRSVEK